MLQCALFLAVFIQSVSGSCNFGWLEYEDSCYSFNKEQFSWYEAAATCLIYGAHLAQVESQEENAWLASQLNDANRPGKKVTSKLPKKVSKWLGSKPPTTYLNWAAGEPNNKDNKGEDCMEIYSNLQWNDASCLKKLAFICEKDA